MDTVRLFVVVCPDPDTVNPAVPEDPWTIRILVLSPDVPPFLTIKEGLVIVVAMSGSVSELLKACCKLIVDAPPAAPPDTSPNLETGVKRACSGSDKFVAFLTTEITPIKIPFVSLFEKVLNTSEETLAAATFKFW